MVVQIHLRIPCAIRRISWHSLRRARERNLPPASAQDGDALAEERRSQDELTQEEKQLVAALALTRAAAENAQRVELFEVGNQFDADFAEIKENEKVAGYPIRRKVDVSGDVIAPLVSTLTDRSAYFEPGNGWMCIFEPHHVLRVESAEQIVNVVICLKCGDVSFAANEKHLILKSMQPEANRKLASDIEGIMSSKPVV